MKLNNCSPNFQGIQKTVKNNNSRRSNSSTPARELKKNDPSFKANIKFFYNDELITELGMKIINISGEFQNIVDNRSHEVLDDGKSMTFVKDAAKNIEMKQIKPLETYIKNVLKSVGIKDKDMKNYIEISE